MQLNWYKSSHSSDNGNCVEVADLAAGGQAVRDSKLGDDSPVLWFATAQVSALAASVKADQLS